LKGWVGSSLEGSIACARHNKPTEATYHGTSIHCRKMNDVRTASGLHVLVVNPSPSVHRLYSLGKEPVTVLSTKAYVVG
jgi:hypothetical protein